MSGAEPGDQWSPPQELLAGYAPAGPFDEMLTPDRRVRGTWRVFLQRLEQFGAHGWGWQFDRMRRLLREHGVSHSIAGTPQDRDGHWELDPIPWLLAQQEWSNLVAGLQQRMRLLNLVLADVYGPQQLVRQGLLPAALIFGNAGFLLPCQGIAPPRSIHLHLYAGELVRGPDGSWLVLADRTQGPSGAGFVVENRVVLSRALPDHFHNLHVERLAPFFLALRETLQSLAPRDCDNPRVVLLSPGPLSPAYFEDAYLARYLGYTLAEGGDLTVRGTQVYLKTLGGLVPVDVILRRSIDAECDPLELKEASLSGVPGLVQAVRSGQVLVANSLGSGFLEAPALLALLPALCRQLLGEDLRVPSVPTWWCALDQDWEYVRAHFDDLIIRPALAPRTRRSVLTADLTPLQRTEHLENIARHRAEFVAQARVAPSTAPVWHKGALHPWYAGLRTFGVATASGDYQILAGGLAHTAARAAAVSDDFKSGRTHKDVWILADTPVAAVTLLRPSAAAAAAVELRRGANDLPSRVADNLFWFGRQVERAEGLVRQLRSCVSRMTSELELPNLAEVAWLVRSLADDVRVPEVEGLDAAEVLKGLRDEVLAFLFQPSRNGGCREALRSLYRDASFVRDRLSVDTWRIVSRLDLDLLFPCPKDQARLGDVLLLLNELLGLLSALSGLGMENMTHGPGWRFMDMGRRLERALHILRLLRATLVHRPAELTPLLEAILEIADSAMTYRYRYLTSLQLPPVLDLLLMDETNPRSVTFQLRALADHVRELPNKSPEVPENVQMQLVLRAEGLLRLADLDALAAQDPQGIRSRLDIFLGDLLSELWQLSDSVSRTYLTHTAPARPLGSAAAADAT
jgi:uncharacterized circularly permuted ATP-grasp superfamily protein/uncharacterized alpha-E superfamily protein